MKIQAKLLALTAISILAVSAQAQPTDFIVNTFDTADEAAGWTRWWGAATQTYEFDPAVDAAGSATSGSLKATIGFNQPAYTGDNQFAVLRTFTVRDASIYTNLVFDLRWDTSSPKRPYNDFGYLEYGFRVNGFDQSWLGGRAIPVDGNWIHFELPIPATLPNIGTVSGIVLKMWAGGAGDGLTGTATFWLDNVKLIAKQAPPPPPPTLSMTRPEPGLNLLASHPTERYQRQNVRAVSTAVSWIDQFDPVTYAITISKFPDGAQGHNNFQAHMFLAPVGSANQNDPFVDYNAPTVIFWQIANNANGSAYTRFMFKTNQPSGNSQLFGAGTLALIGDASPVGRWTLTFSGNTDVTIQTPSGSVTNFTMPAEAVAMFRDDTRQNALYAFFGAQNNEFANIGQQAVFSRIEVIREFDSIDDQFNGPGLDVSKWAVVALNAPGVVAVPPDAIGWLNWTLPDVGFGLEQTGNLADSSSWAAATTLAPAQIIDHKRVLLTPANAGGPNGFFRLQKPATP